MEPSGFGGVIRQRERVSVWEISSPALTARSTTRVSERRPMLGVAPATPIAATTRPVASRTGAATDVVPTSPSS